MKKNLIKFAMMAIAMFTMGTVMTSCSKDDDNKENPSAILTYKVRATVSVTNPTDKGEELKNIVNSIVLSDFTAPKNATSEELNAKVTQIAKAANMETVVKDKALAAGLKSYTIAFNVVSDGNKRMETVSYSISYIAGKDAEDVVQNYTMTAMNLQVGNVTKEELNDLDAIRDTYRPKLTFTFTGTKEEAFNAMKKYLESDETKEFREALQKHTATYNDANEWYFAFRMRGENGLFSDNTYFGDKKPAFSK